VNHWLQNYFQTLPIGFSLFNFRLPNANLPSREKCVLEGWNKFLNKLFIYVLKKKLFDEFFFERFLLVIIYGINFVVHDWGFFVQIFFSDVFIFAIKGFSFYLDGVGIKFFRFP
jgi:hypothetical protein